ncbi:MAG: hypothetical protein AAF196_00865 [Planctomycetota bacterium]
MVTLRFAVCSTVLSSTPWLLASCAGVPFQVTQAETTTETRSEDSKDWSERVKNPVSFPTIFESPTIQREARPIFIHQQHPDRVLGLPVGGDFQLYALQVRVPLTDKLAFIANKDGFIDFNPGGTFQQDTGFADVGAGLKYAVYEDENVIVTPGLTFEVPVGNAGVFQGNGDGLFRPFVRVGWEPMPELNILGSVGGSIPVSSEETESIDYHLHLGYEVSEWFMPLVEFHGITYTGDADPRPFGIPFAGQLPFEEGGDLINLGSTDVEGNTSFTGAAGARFQISDGISFGATYGFPLSDPQGIYDFRITTDLSIEF